MELPDCHANAVLSLSIMNKIINIFWQRHERKNFFF